MTLAAAHRHWTKVDGVCAAADCTSVCSLVSGFMKAISFVYVAYMPNCLTLGMGQYLV
jgi:hypothetical protein